MAGCASDGGIPIRRIDAFDLPELVASTRQTVAEYEQRYELASDMMAELVDRDAIIPTIDIIKWYHAYDELKFLLKITSGIEDPGNSTS